MKESSIEEKANRWDKHRRVLQEFKDRYFCSECGSRERLEVYTIKREIWKEAGMTAYILWYEYVNTGMHYILNIYLDKSLAERDRDEFNNKYSKNGQISLPTRKSYIQEYPVKEE